VEERTPQVYNVWNTLTVGGRYAHYEFFCHACEKTFTKILRLAEYEEGKVVCPHCGSNKEVEQSWSAFYAISPKKTA
jgi:putative FmdB family regulatory protein